MKLLTPASAALAFAWSMAAAAQSAGAQTAPVVAGYQVPGGGDQVPAQGVQIIGYDSTTGAPCVVGQTATCLLAVSGGTGGAGGAITAASGALASGAVVDIGAAGSTACATDTGSCNVNSLLQRALQRDTTLITAIGTPFQAGGAIGNSTFAATSTVGSPTSTPTISTSAYVSGYVLGGVQSFAGQPTTGMIPNAAVTFNSGSFSGSVDLVILNASPTGGGASDHAAFALTATDTGKVVGVLHLTDCTSLGGVLAQCQTSGQTQVYTLAASGTTIYAVAVVRGAPTFAGASDVTFSLNGVK